MRHVDVTHSSWNRKVGRHAHFPPREVRGFDAMVLQRDRVLLEVSYPGAALTTRPDDYWALAETRPRRLDDRSAARPNSQRYDSSYRQSPSP